MSIRYAPFLFAALSLMGSAQAASIFTTQVPGSGDSSPNSRSVELGVRFRADTAGQITGLRFYKTAGNTGTHTGHLWTNAGVLLGSLTFAGEAATGWQTANFPSPIPIQAGTTYVASYHTAAYYAVTRQTFAAAGIDNPPLHALRDGLDGVNGLYVYSSAAAFPNRGTRSSNYWVDVLFSAAGSSVPAVLGLSPSSATAGGGGFALQVLGSGFLSSSTVRWNGAGRPTTFVSSSALSALISSADVVSAGTAAVTVLNPPPGGGLSNAAVFTVAPAPDVAPPAVSISSPAGGEVVHGVVAVVATSTDDVAVATVQFRLDGAGLGPPDDSPPYSVGWNTASATDGAHGLSAVAWDRAGNASTSAIVVVLVDNSPPLISSISVASAGRSSAAVVWATDEPATSQVEYGTSTAYGASTEPDASTVTAHERILSGLSAGTTYHYRVRSADAAGNLAVSADSAFTTAPDAAAPPFFDDFSSYTPDVCFADGTVFGSWTSVFNGYGCTSVKAEGGRFWLEESPFASASSSETHAALVSGMSFDSPLTLSVDARTVAQLRTESPPNPWEVAWLIWNYVDNAHFYYFVPKPNGWELGKEDPAYPGAQRFLAAGSTPSFPIGVTYNIKVVQIQNVMTVYVNGALITTFTDAERPYTSGRISLYAEDAAVRFTNVAVNFSTPPADAAAPSVVISAPSAGAAVSGSALVAAAATDNVSVATIQFRLDGAALGPPDAAAPYALSWDTSLSSDGPHGLSAVAWDREGNASTSAAVFVAVDNTPPVISSVSVVDVGQSSAAVAWLTNEPATAQVEYGTSAVYGSATAFDASTAAAHARVLSGLSAGTQYHYRVRSIDAAGNLAVSGDDVFATSTQASCLTGAGAWAAEPLPPQISSFTFSFDATPGAPGSIGLSSGAADSLSALAAEVRFNSQGFIDVRHSTSYAGMTPVAYSTGAAYHFDLRVSVSGHLFDVYVTSAGGSPLPLARNYTFRAAQSTTTSLDHVGVFAAAGGLAVCNASLSASTAPWWDGVRELYATVAGSKTWYSSWDNGINRSFGFARDPIDPWFDAAHGSASYLVDAASGVFKISGSAPRMYIHHPEFVKGSSSVTVENSHAKQWRDVEMTVYAMRVADSNVAYAGIDGAARTNHGTTGSETAQLCDTRGVGARIRYDGHLDFYKETRHPTSYAINNTTTTFWPVSASMPFNVWIGYKHVVYDLPDGNVVVEHYMDMTDGAGGGAWFLVNRFEDDGADWGGGTPCAPGVNPQERLTNGSSRPGSESGLPNASVYFRSDGVGVNGLLYKKMSVREIVAPSGGAGPLAAFGAPPGPGGAAPAAAEEAFLFRDLYAFPNPSRRGERVTIRLQAGVADAVDVDIFDLSGRRVNGGSAVGPVLMDDGNGKGPQFTYDYHWNVSGARSAVYLYKVNARKQGQPGIGRTGKVALIK